jgi:hypothetical protein
MDRKAIDVVHSSRLGTATLWTLRVSGMGGYTSKCEKKSKSLHPKPQVLKSALRLGKDRKAIDVFQSSRLGTSTTFKVSPKVRKGLQSHRCSSVV